MYVLKSAALRLREVRQGALFVARLLAAWWPVAACWVKVLVGTACWDSEPFMGGLQIILRNIYLQGWQRIEAMLWLGRRLRGFAICACTSGNAQN